MASSYSSSSNDEVFLSFRGDDTRETFTSHLFYGLCQKKVKTFMDENIEKGKKISADLLNAIIEGSKISIVIISEHYANSKWCLDELVKVLECKKLKSQIVIPIFYGVHPSDVRTQKGSFGKGFEENRKNFQKMEEKVQNWRDALIEASYLSGHESTKFRNDAILVDIIVKDVLKKLEDLTISTYFDGLVGIDSRINKVKSLLRFESPESQIVGIWGMGGVGKTTLAKTMFKRHSYGFESKIFVENVREKCEKGGGLEVLQKEILSELLKEENVKSRSNLPQYTNQRKVLIVLDDVSRLEQLEYLVGGLDRFGLGSKIIITTRDREVLLEFGVDNIYEFGTFNDDEALEMFCNHAFRQNTCPEGFLELSKKVVDYAEGNALALKVLGCHFHKKSKIGWEKELPILSEISSLKIHNVLKISYDELNLDEKSIFLDIACFFKGEDKDWVMDILDDDQVIVDYRLNVLVEKSLVSISNFNGFQMHDLLQEMGREIVRQESIKNPGKRSRLWHCDDIYNVLKNNKGTDSIEGIFLDMSTIRDLDLTPRAFEKMSNLRLLKLYVPFDPDISNVSSKVHLPKDLDFLPNELRYLHWHGYPWRTLPTNFSADNLVEVDLPYSEVQQLWEGEKEASRLKVVDLQHSNYLNRIPDPVETPNLERIIVSDCKRLSRLPSSIQNFNNLGLLSCEGLTSLSCFPNNIHFRSPIEIDLSCCFNLMEFPSISGNVIKLRLSGTAIKEVPSSIDRLTSLQLLDLSNCYSLTCLPTSICKLKFLTELNLSGCSNFERFPEISGGLRFLCRVYLEGTKIKELLSSFERLMILKTLHLPRCCELASMPRNLTNLEVSDTTDKRRRASFYGSRGLVLPPLSGLSNLSDLTLYNCDIREIPEDIGCLSSLESLHLIGNAFESLPPSIKQLSRLRGLQLMDCYMLISLPELPRSLRHLEARGCDRLESLPELPEFLESLDVSTARCDPWIINHEFIRCPKLKEKANDILASDSQLRIQHMAIVALSAKPRNGSTISLCGTAVKIPEWFRNQCSGSSITIQLPLQCVIGFAYCVVVGFEEDSDFNGEIFGVECRYGVKMKIASSNIAGSKIINLLCSAWPGL
ncbi:Disease resistance protein (TIR-NBS-LRR class) family [Melia azedarach]|uniref:Disease resistance protein (TIR-NBS-LRR class) family n=1 Tax=Melia azedarach TaxID=155640 RepID=A0ACC1YL80_MELAZ|nr:Disease resistance protein (TIR-NBS-LRR class) family [Melia azedarach]